MCGICGFVQRRGSQAEKRALLRAMTARLQHRGPDDDGFHVDPNVALGMRRLSIIDLETGEQPITNEDKTVWLIFNGEIYNYEGIRSRLIEKGHRFRSKGDTEVLVHAYEEVGDDFLSELNGMFALALWDSKRERLLLARDRLGIKPLYYTAAQDALVFGSELKAVMAHPVPPREIDLAALDQFLTLEYVPGPRTIFDGVSKLPPGHKLVFEHGVLELEPYWMLTRDPQSDQEDVLEGQLLGLIEDSVRLRMISDVPLGSFLSGGIDSSTILAHMAKLSNEPVTAFTIGFQDSSYNELPYAELVAKKFEANHVTRVIQPDIYELAMQLISHFDEPFADFSIFPTYLVSQIARERVKVVLSGDGGDEIFGGYDTYMAQSIDRYYRLLPASIRGKLLPNMLDLIPPRPDKKGFVNRAKRFVEGGAYSSSLQHSRWMMFMSHEDKARLYTDGLLESVDEMSVSELLEGWFKRVDGMSSLAQQQYVDIHTYLPDDILTKVDRMSMAVSLEARVPLLDHRIVEFAWNLPTRLKLQRMQTKVLLRRAMRGTLPGEVLSKPKEGFSIPIKHWLRGPLRPLMEELLSPEELRSSGLFRPDCVNRWMREHLAERSNHSHRLWALMVFQVWFRTMMAEPVRGR